MPRADSVFTATTGAAQRKRWNRFRRTILTPIRPSRKFPPWSKPKAGKSACALWPSRHLQSTLSLWYLHSNSELQQDGDTGATVASEQSSNRYGLEWANYYTPREHWALDFDIADSRALFTQIDPDDAAQSIVNGNVTTSYVNGNGNAITHSFPYPKGVLQSGPGGKLGARSGSGGDFIGRHTARLPRLFVEFAPALLWSARFDV